MFDLGFWEILVIGVIALLVIGPERLPEVARTVGRWVGKAQKFVATVKSDVDRELRTDELRKMMDSQKSELDQLKSRLDNSASELNQDVATSGKGTDDDGDSGSTNSEDRYIVRSPDNTAPGETKPVTEGGDTKPKNDTGGGEPKGGNG
ncbi:MAG: Sec-independent protein translocase protein TatB [Pseudomonadota bacterium]